MSKSLTIAVLTATRAEYGILKPILSAIKNNPDMELKLLIGGTHLLGSFGNTQEQIVQDGFTIEAAIPFLSENTDTELDVAKSTGLATSLIAEALSGLKPDALVLLGDRYETLGAATAALLLNVPIVHLFGGETTQGAVDEQIRHAITKMAHIHCTPTDETAARILQMGEEPDRVFVTGHPALDALTSMKLPGRPDLEDSLGGAFKDTLYVVTYHPETLKAGTQDDLDALLAALKNTAQDATIILTYPNADAGHAQMVKKLESFAAAMPDARLVESLGQARYYGLLSIADAVIGNSSSGLLEAPSFGLPTLNIGDRQKGRTRAASVIDVPADQIAIEHAIKDLAGKDFSGTKNPYAKDNAVQAVVDAIASIAGRKDILVKRFVDKA